MNIFEKFSTEDRRFTLYRNVSFFVNPNPYLIFKHGEKKVWGMHVPLRNSLKCLFELPGVYESVKRYMQTLYEETDEISNIIQGDLWKKVYKNVRFDDNNIQIPCNIYSDAFETGNALGSHAGEQSLTGIYVTLPTLPPHLVSKFVLLSSIVYTKHLKKFGNATVFRKVIEDINDISENGLKININGKEITLFFQCTLVLGDNLGLNSTCGFHENFVKVPYCRICTADHNLCKTMCQEMPELIRSENDYEKELDDENKKESAVKEKCVFNNIRYFHITRNRTNDMMHDLFEGMSDYSLSDNLTALIYKDKLFSLDDLNERIVDFKYGDFDSKPRPLNEHYKGSERKIRIKQSAAESMCLIRYLPVMIGDLIPDRNNKYWQVILTLRKIVDILLAPRFRKQNLWYLKYLIETHHSMYKALFGDLKPKMHMLLHYISIMIANGPVVHFWSMMQL